jgi:DNA-binding beta-propeller fold protein YncE
VAPPPLADPLAVISCYDDGAVDVRDANGFAAIGTATSGDRSAGVAADSGRRAAYVATESRISALDLRTAEISVSAEVSGSRFSEVALLSGGYIAATDNNASSGKPGVRIFRQRARGAPELAGAAIAGETPEGIVASADGRSFYVTNVNGNSVMRFAFDDRLAKAAMTGQAQTGHRPFGVALDEMHRLLFVADNDTPTVSGDKSLPGLEVFSLPGLRRVARISTGSANALPLGVAVDAAANRVFVTNEGDGTVAAYSIVPLRAIARSSTGRTPWLPAIDRRRGELYVPSAMGDSFSVFDARSLRPIAEDVPTCGYPTSIAIFE